MNHPDYDPYPSTVRPKPQNQGPKTMHNSRLIFLTDAPIVAVIAYYDHATQPELFKTFITDLKPDDLITAESSGRHKHSVLKVLEVDVEIDVDSEAPIRWITGKIDVKGYEETISQEKMLIDKANSARRERKAAEMRRDMFGEDGVPPIAFIDAKPVSED